MKLNEYLEANGTKKSFFAKKLGILPQMLTTWLSGRTMPRIEMILKIEEATGGKVKAKDWVVTV